VITLRELARTDRAVGSITTDECHMIAAVLDSASRNPVVRLFLPKAIRKKQLAMRMLAATLGRTPDEREPSLQAQIRREMEASKWSK
jgi:hypothetical protein